MEGTEINKWGGEECEVQGSGAKHNQGISDLFNSRDLLLFSFCNYQAGYD